MALWDRQSPQPLKQSRLVRKSYLFSLYSLICWPERNPSLNRYNLVLSMTRYDCTRAGCPGDGSRHLGVMKLSGNKLGFSRSVYEFYEENLFSTIRVINCICSSQNYSHSLIHIKFRAVMVDLSKSSATATSATPEKSQKAKPEKPDEQLYKDTLQKAEREHAAVQEKVVRA